MSVEDKQLSSITLLLEFACKPDSETELPRALGALFAELMLPAAAVSAWVATSAPVVTCYIDAPARLADMRKAAEAHAASLLTGPIELSRLQMMARHPGASYNAAADFHYVVRTDVVTGGDAELERWYDEEHMAMLAAVPGTVQARRLISLDAKPRYYACYDLVAPAVLQSPEWLKVRRTPWSERVRPTFTNTRRVICRKLELSNPIERR